MNNNDNMAEVKAKESLISNMGYRLGIFTEIPRQSRGFRALESYMDALVKTPTASDATKITHVIEEMRKSDLSRCEVIYNDLDRLLNIIGGEKHV